MNVSLRITQNTLGPGLHRIVSALEGAGKRRMLQIIGRKFWEMTRANFGPSGKYRPAYWQALSKRYQQRIKYYGPPKLVFKGRLREGIHFTVTANEALVYSDSDYAAVHQFGGGNVPARPYFPVEGGAGEFRLTAVAEREIQTALETEIVRILG